MSRSRSPDKLTLDEYERYCKDPESVDLTVPKLNEILHMHGYAKMHKSRKEDIKAAVNSIIHMPVKRSTLFDPDVSSGSSHQGASLTVDEVCQDFAHLGWEEEGRVTSLETYPESDPNIDNEQGGYPLSWPKKRRTKRKSASEGGTSTDGSAPPSDDSAPPSDNDERAQRVRQNTESSDDGSGRSEQDFPVALPHTKAPPGFDFYQGNPVPLPHTPAPPGFPYYQGRPLVELDSDSD